MDFFLCVSSLLQLCPCDLWGHSTTSATISAYGTGDTDERERCPFLFILCLPISLYPSPLSSLSILLSPSLSLSIPPCLSLYWFCVCSPCGIVALSAVRTLFYL